MNEKYGKKTKHHKKIFKSQIIAEVVGCSERHVRNVREKEKLNKPIETPLEQTIQVADMLMNDGFDNLREAVKKAVKF